MSVTKGIGGSADTYLLRVMKDAGTEVVMQGNADVTGVDVLFAMRDRIHSDIAALTQRAHNADLASVAGRADLRDTTSSLADASAALDTLLSLGA